MLTKCFSTQIVCLCLCLSSWLCLCVSVCVHACVCVYVSVPVTLSVGPADLGCHGDGCHSAVATVTETAGFRVISASHLGHQSSAIYSKPYMITAFFFWPSSQKGLKEHRHQVLLSSLQKCGNRSRYKKSDLHWSEWSSWELLLSVRGR